MQEQTSHCNNHNNKRKLHQNKNAQVGIAAEECMCRPNLDQSSSEDPHHRLMFLVGWTGRRRTASVGGALVDIGIESMVWYIESDLVAFR